MIRIHCDQDDVELTGKADSIKIKYTPFGYLAMEKEWSLVFCNEGCAATYLIELGRKRKEDELEAMVQ